MSFELVEVTLLHANLQLNNVVSWSAFELRPPSGDDMCFFDLVRCARAQRSSRGRLRSNERRENSNNEANHDAANQRSLGNNDYAGRLSDAKKNRRRGGATYSTLCDDNGKPFKHPRPVVWAAGVISMLPDDILLQFICTRSSRHVDRVVVQFRKVTYVASRTCMQT